MAYILTVAAHRRGWPQLLTENADADAAAEAEARAAAEAAAEAEAWARENDASHDNTITEFIRRSPVPVSPELKDVVCAAPFHSLAGRHCHWCQQRGPRAAACTHMRQSADAQRCRLQMGRLLLSDALDKKVLEDGLQVRPPTPALARAWLHGARGGGGDGTTFT